jgi:hypothetical protein
MSYVHILVQPSLKNLLYTWSKRLVCWECFSVLFSPGAQKRPPLWDWEFHLFSQSGSFSHSNWFPPKCPVDTQYMGLIYSPAFEAVRASIVLNGWSNILVVTHPFKLDSVVYPSVQSCIPIQEMRRACPQLLSCHGLFVREDPHFVYVTSYCLVWYRAFKKSVLTLNPT